MLSFDSEIRSKQILDVCLGFFPVSEGWGCDDSRSFYFYDSVQEYKINRPTCYIFLHGDSIYNFLTHRFFSSII